MRLATIKLSGFKSFVDPTVLHLPTNMTGIVGPNGCGKSNIIDAIRWVMGESAASRLRGDAITDVIFSGSGARKPVGTASVELLFDNSEGLIGGEYARFNEISVKRTVSRDGQSNYFLNGSRCRRRDIVDVFLGTGLGARSYSIIEQGMISHIIEARPEELRTHLEEAAGISKYKERRKETESRIKATRENLDRVTDVRQEVEKNLEHLNRQARTAERWQKLKAEATRLDAELKALSWVAENAELDSQAAAVRQLEVEIEATAAQQSEVESRLEAFRERQNEATQAFNGAQAEVYRIGGEIARIEQQLQHGRELMERLRRSELETQKQADELEEHIRHDGEQVRMLAETLAEGQPKAELLQAEVTARAEAAQQAEQALAEWQSRWDRYAQSSGEAARSAEVERTRLDYLDKQALAAARRLEALDQERQQLDVSQLGEQAERLQREQHVLRGRIDELTATLGERKARYAEQQERQRQLQGELAQARQELEKSQGRLSSLEALQHAALGQDAAEASTWLERLGLSRAKRLGEELVVAEGWETAAETVLHGILDAVLTDAPHEGCEHFAELRQTNLSLLRKGGEWVAKPGSLSMHVRGPHALQVLLDEVRIAEDLAGAQALARDLPSGGSVITPAGEWLGRDWSRVVRGGGAQQGVITREREIQSLGERLRAAQQAIQDLASALDGAKQAIAEAEVARDDTQRELYAAHRQLSEVSGQLQGQQGRFEAARCRLAQIDEETGALRAQLLEGEAQTKASRGAMDTAVGRMGELEAQRLALDGERRGLLERREEARVEAHEARERAHQHALGLEAKRAALRSLEQALARMGAQKQALAAQAEDLRAQLQQGVEPAERLEAERRAYLDQRLLSDKDLVAARQVLDQLDAETRQFEADRHRVERVLLEQRETLSSHRLRQQGAQMRADALAAAIVAAGFEAQAIAAELPPEAEVAVWQARLEDLEARIKRMEPVNLAAIHEHAEQQERKQYLDAQLHDLSTALETLETAIKKIDRETRARFKETFDKVNQGLQELFPRLFGGGHAYLELTSEDLLDTGVTIMARPPGKRISSISLLSGGEKALTAVSLVFAIFRLNPAPFCLLDEVDAPLDEANVSRFCNMVREMSERVQFLFVTHNKVTMEAANQLCGVTMREPGVSRLVQVDLGEAAQLAGAA